MSAKSLIVFGMAACVLATPALAGGAAPLRLAQSTQPSLNPTSDPDVQRGIDERNKQERDRLEQERKQRIEACVQAHEVDMTTMERFQRENSIRDNCSRQVETIGIRG
jgi:hypothetical protein